MLAFGGILIALVGKMLIDEKLIVFSGVITSVIGIFLVAAFPMLKSLLRPKLNIGRTPQQSLPPAETTKKLSPINDFAYIPSVVENTTDLLKEPVPIRSKH